MKGWFITREEPTADQRGVAEKRRDRRVVAVSFDQFRSKLVDARMYIDLRQRYPYGSVRDPETGDTPDKLDYVALDLVRSDGTSYSIKTVLTEVQEGKRFVILGDYGAGKSSTMREVFVRVAARFWDNKTFTFPILLNLRDHHGQTDPTEALERHARRIGYSAPSHLVRAWRAGYVVLLLDGFDEIATAGWAGRTKTLKDLRYRSMELVREFVRQSPPSAAVLLSGRAHFFDTEKEMAQSLGLDAGFARLSLSEFTDEQVGEYLKKRGWVHAVPAWLPSRPLLLGYLASRNLLQQTLEVDVGSSPAVGWHGLIERISAREAEIEAGIDAGTVRKLIERLATLARNSADGLGPISSKQITDAFSGVCGYEPDDRGAVLLQRLPGLGVHSSEDESRIFIDQDLAETARAGDVYSYIVNPFGAELDVSGWQRALKPLGLEVVALRCSADGVPESKLSAAATQAAKTVGSDTLACDIVLSLHQLGSGYQGPPIYVSGVLVPELVVDTGAWDLRKVEFQDALFTSFELGNSVDINRLPRFVRCYFGTIEGRAGVEDLPSSTFVDCVIDSFNNTAQTTNAILQLGLPLGTKVLLTVLKKLYAQSGSGRRESALLRGLDHRAQSLVPEVMGILRREGFVTRAKMGEQVVWLPTRSADTVQRALRILAAPHNCADILLHQSGALD